MRAVNRSIKYIDWLMDRIGFYRKGYTKLMDLLYDIPFETVIYRDYFRADDGRDLRIDYGEQYFSDDDEISVLEVLIALAIRVDNEYIGDPSNPDPEFFFWEMICNLGLDKYTDRCFDRNKVCDIVETWLLREFKYDGRGSIFPIEHPIQDQRDIELWSQMQEYISENFS